MEKIMKVYIADNFPPIRQYLEDLIASHVDLKDQGIEVIGQTGDVSEAVRDIPQLNPDVVILDISMSGGSGIDVLERIRKVNKSSPVIIMLTNYPFPQYRKRCMELGADYFFDKSKEFQKIAEVLKIFREKLSLHF
jgi:DNA-binding NarL/FixJ family response regulator